MEMSHRSKDFDAQLERAENGLRHLLGLTDDFDVLFLQGGATLAIFDGADEFAGPTAPRRLSDFGRLGRQSHRRSAESRRRARSGHYAKRRISPRADADEIRSWTKAPNTFTSPPTKPSAACSGPANPTPTEFPLFAICRRIFCRGPLTLENLA